jgi:hypothetical protein
MSTLRALLIGVALLAALVLPVSGAAGPFEAVSTFTYSPNMHPLGFSPRENTAEPNFTANSDIAFWGSLAYHGNYDGFRIVDISAPANPKELNDYRECAGNQGDVIIWKSILVRSWNSAAPAGATCDGEPLPPSTLDANGWEGVNIFDVSNPLDPDLVASVETLCGSHTETAVPDPANNRLLIYNNSSSGACPGIDIIEIPLDNPAAAHYLRFEPAGRSCHDGSVILGSAMLAACAGTVSGQPGFTAWSIGGPRGGSLEDPAQLFSVNVTGTTTGHSVAFSWDGKVLIFGTEPGGGSAPRCTPTGTVFPNGTVQTDEMKSLFFFSTEDGSFTGKWTLPRDQTLTENCTIHNYNVVPTTKGRVLVSGNYQSGIAVVDFTDPANAKEIAFADPAPLDPNTLELGGDWSSYWYDGRIYESDITRGLLIWELTDPAVATAQRLGHLTPQTQEFTIG